MHYSYVFIFSFLMISLSTASEKEMQLDPSEEETRLSSYEVSLQAPEAKKRKREEDEVEVNSHKLLTNTSSSLINRKNHYLITVLEEYMEAIRHIQEGQRLLNEYEDWDDENFQPLLADITTLNSIANDESKFFRAITAIEERNLSKTVILLNYPPIPDGLLGNLVHLPIEMRSIIGRLVLYNHESLRPTRTFPELLYNKENKGILEIQKEHLQCILEARQIERIFPDIFRNLNLYYEYNCWYNLNDNETTDDHFEVYFHNRLVDIILNILNMYNIEGSNKSSEELSYYKNRLISVLRKISHQVKKDTFIYKFLQGHLLELNNLYRDGEKNPHFSALQVMRMRQPIEGTKAHEMETILDFTSLTDQDSAEVVNSSFRRAFATHINAKKTWHNQAIFMWIERVIFGKPRRGSNKPDMTYSIIESMPNKLLEMYEMGNSEPLEIYIQLSFLGHKPEDQQQHLLDKLLNLINNKKLKGKLRNDEAKIVLVKDIESYLGVLYWSPYDKAEKIIEAGNYILNNPFVLIGVHLKCLKTMTLAYISQRNTLSVQTTYNMYKEVINNLRALDPYIGKYIILSDHEEFENEVLRNFRELSIQ